MINVNIIVFLLLAVLICDWLINEKDYHFELYSNNDYISGNYLNIFLGGRQIKKSFTTTKNEGINKIPNTKETKKKQSTNQSKKNRQTREQTTPKHINYINGPKSSQRKWWFKPGFIAYQSLTFHYCSV